MRLVGDEVVRVETIEVNGEKLLRTEKEVNREQPTLAKGQETDAHPANTPTLRRPGEEPASTSPTKPPSGRTQPVPPPAPIGSDAGPGAVPN